MLGKRQVGFIKNNSYTNVQQVYKHHATPYQKQEFSSFHCQYPDSDDNEFSVFVLNKNNKRKQQKQPNVYRSEYYTQQKKINPKQNLKKQSVFQTQENYENSYKQNQRVLNRNYFSAANLNLLEQKSLKNQKLALNKQKLDNFGKAPKVKDINSKKVTQISFLKKNQPSKQVEQSQVIESSQSVIYRKKVAISPPIQQRIPIKQNFVLKQQEKLKYEYSESQSSKSQSERSSPSSSSQQQQQQNQQFQSEFSLIRPKNYIIQNQQKLLADNSKSKAKHIPKHQNKIDSHVYQQMYSTQRKQNLAQEQVNSKQQLKLKLKTLQPMNESSSSSQEQPNYISKQPKPKNILEDNKRKAQQYQKQGIVVSKGGLCFDINPKDFIVPQQQAIQMEKKYEQKRNIMRRTRQKVNINSVEQKKRRRQLAKNYDKYARYQIFGNY